VAHCSAHMHTDACFKQPFFVCCRFAHLRNEIDWGLQHDPSACIGYAALELGRRGFVPVSKLTERTCPDRFGGAWAALSQVGVCSMPGVWADVAECVAKLGRTLSNTDADRA
jgi:hypothetical protein